MDNLIAKLKKYLLQTLGIEVHFRPWSGQKRLPIFLTNAYSFQEGSILGKPCLFMFAMQLNHHTPGNIRKYWEQIRRQYSGITIYVQTTITAYDRQRLIGQRIPFMVPGKQMFIPDMGIELREHFQPTPSNENQYLSPAAQAIVIYALLGKIGEKTTASTLAKPLGYTLMTISRAFAELTTAEIGVTHKVGKERWWLPSGTKQELWQQAKSKMRSPIMRLTWIKNKPKSLKPSLFAGLSALSHYSLLNHSSQPIYAIDKKTWGSWKSAGVEESPTTHDALFELQIWHYNPTLLSENNNVDPFSLFLSLENTNDERVEIALDNMMRNITW